jgi:hypothetical protein
MNERSYEISRRQRLIEVLAAEAFALVTAGEYTPQGAVNAAMHTYRGSVLDQRTALFGPVIKEVRRLVQEADKRKTEDWDTFLSGAASFERQLLSDFDGEDRPCEPSV